MNPIISRFELCHAPERRVPGAEMILADPARHAAGLLRELPAGVTPLEIRRVVHRNFANDPCQSLLVSASDGRNYLALNELGPDAYGEVEAAGGALAAAMRVPFAEGPPAHWPAQRRSVLGRLFGYAA